MRDWFDQREAILRECASRFGATAQLAVRSDASSEDQAGTSMAGAFLSLLDVPQDQLACAIDRVAASLPGDAGDKILVQEMVQHIEHAGVAATHRIADGAPWYCLEIAPQDGAAVTAGRATGRHLALARSHAESAVALRRWSASELLALALVQEVEALAGGQPLEIEFATSRDTEGRLRAWLLQVRPLTTPCPLPAQDGLSILASLDFLGEPDAEPDIVGSRTVLSLMSDWNPAELLGAHPRPLALSLFNQIIGHGVWWDARAALGYAAVPPTPRTALLRVLSGRPFVDVRRSANSLLPHGLTLNTRQQLVNAWIERLTDAPELHDKVEFEVYRTVRDFRDTLQLRQQWAPLLGTVSWLGWEHALCTLTRPMMDMGPDGLLRRHMGQISVLEQEAVEGRHWQELLARAGYGAFSFAVLARIAFAAEAQLRSSVARDALSTDRAAALRAAGRSGPVKLFETDDSASFVARHSHLRPGTFDITQHTWAARKHLPLPQRSNRRTPTFALRSAEQRALQALLSESDLTATPDAWVCFVQESARAREWSKFVFSRHLSAALDGIAAMLAQCGLNHSMASWLTLQDIQHGLALAPRKRADHWSSRAAERQAVHATQSQLIVSPLLRHCADRYVADSMGVLPNFVGQQSVTAPTVVIESSAECPAQDALNGVIAIIRQADPGFDWLFDAGIVGLVTAWGGANSHMAIRCTEYGLPAAIGCGEAVFARAAQASRASIDPISKALWLH